MGIKYAIVDDPGITIVCWHRDVTAEDFLRHVQRLVVDPQWPPAAGLQLADLTTMYDPAMMKNDYVHSVSELYADYLQRLSAVRIAVVASKEFHSIDAFKRFMDHYASSAHLFASTHEACDWLGVQPSMIESVLKGLRGKIEAEEPHLEEQNSM